MTLVRIFALIVGLFTLAGEAVLLEAAPITTAKSPISIVPNRGQVIDTDGRLRSDITFVSENGPVKLYFSKRGISYVYARREYSDDERAVQLNEEARDRDFVTRLYRVDLEFVAARSDLQLETEENPQAGYFNYFLGHCPEGITRVQPLQRICYRNIYPRIDLIVRPTDSGIKYDFEVHPGGDPRDIVLRYHGAESLNLSRAGDLIVDNPLGSLEESAPYVYQEAPAATKDGRQPVQARFALEASTIRFALGHYDRSRTLVIDPGVIWSTYYGGHGLDEGRDVDVDNNGDVLITGVTASSFFPVQAGQFQTVHGGKRDAFVLKFDQNRQRVWTTFYGGRENDEGNGIHVSKTRSVSIVGTTFSKDLPLRGNSIQTTILNLDPVAFVAKFNRDGDMLWSTFYGGGEPDAGIDIAGDARGNVAIVGHTREMGANFPLRGAWQTENKNNGQSLFIALLTSSGRILWSTYFGGSGSELASGIAVDNDGNVIVSGTTKSDDFPVSTGAFQSERPGPQSAVLVKLSPTGNRIWSTYVGGTAWDVSYCVAVDSTDNVMLGGRTRSTDFPLIDPLQASLGNDPLLDAQNDGFLALFDAGGRQRWGTFWGAECQDEIHTVAFYPDGGFLFGGLTRSINMRVTDDADQSLHSFGTDDTKCLAPVGPSNDMFYVKVSAGSTKELLYSSYLGGDFEDIAFGIAAVGPLTADGNILVAGTTSSDGLKVVDPVFQKTKSLVEDVFIFEHGCRPQTEISADGPLEFCEGDAVELDAGPDFASYEWSNGETSRRIRVEESGSFYVTVVDALGCALTTEPVTVTVWPIPMPVIETDGPTVLCDGDRVTLDAGPGYAAYEWSTGEDSRQISVSEEGVYFVKVRNEGGCESEEIDTTVLVRKKPEPYSEPLELDFGELDGCKSNAELALTFFNPEGFPIRIESIQFSDDAFAFTQPSLPQAIPAGASLPIGVLFTPDDDTPEEVRMTVAGSPCEWSYEVTVKGRKGSIVFSATPGSADFGPVLLCDPALRDTIIEFRNNGTGDVRVEQPSIAAPFEIIAPGAWPQIVAPDGLLAVELRFAPTLAGAAAAELRLPFVAGECNSTARIAFAAEAVDADLTTPAFIDFGELKGCDDSSTLTITLQNESLQQMVLMAVDDPDGIVEAVTTLPRPIDGRSDNPLELRFSPSAAGSQEGSFVIRYRLGPCDKELRVDYRGLKQDDTIDLPADIDFGTLLACIESTKTLPLAIDSKPGLRIKSVDYEGPFSGTLTTGDDLPGEFNLVFSPDADGDAAGAISLVVEPCDRSYRIELRGRRESLSLSGPATEIFAATAPGQSSEREWRYRNEGSGAITIEALDCVEEPFRIISPTAADLPEVLEPGEELLVRIAYQPLAVGEDSGRLCLRNGGLCALNTETTLSAVSVDDAGRVRIVIPDLTAHPDARNFRIPVLAENVELPQQGGPYSFFAYVRFNATMFFPRAAAAGDIIDNRLSAGERLLAIRVDDVLPQTGMPLTEIVGDALLGNEARTAIYLDSVVWISGNIVAELDNGSLTLDELCEAAGTRLLDYDEEFGIALVAPNPSAGRPEIHVRGIAGEISSLSIYALSGRELLRTEWLYRPHAQESGDLILRPDIDLPAGAYRVVFRSSIWTDSASLHIIK